MVMLTRGWSKFLIFVGFMLELFGALAPPLDDEPAESELTTAIQAQPVQQATPPASMPVGNRFMYMQPQYASRHTPQDDEWWMRMPAVLRDLAAMKNSDA